MLIKKTLLKKILIQFTLFALLTPNFEAKNLKKNHSELLIDVTSSKILYAKNASLKIPPASLTKLMTLFVLFDKLRMSQIKINDKVFFSRIAVQQKPSKLNVKPGDSITIRNAIYALITKSANDTAYAIAERLAGNEKQFAKLMNANANLLKMYNTHFVNASGLHNKNQYTTAMDMCKLALSLLKTFPEYFHYFSKKGFFHKGAYLANHNKLLGFSQYEFLVDGMKTGFVNASGFNIVASATKGDKRLIAIVMGANSQRERDVIVQKLFKYGFSKTTFIPKLTSKKSINKIHYKGRQKSKNKKHTSLKLVSKKSKRFLTSHKKSLIKKRRYLH